MKTDVQAVVDSYIRELERELAALPRSRRREVVDDISAHISEARSETGENESAVRDLLDRLGEPAEIAAEARDHLDVRPSKVGFVEVAAIVLLPIGGIVLPVLGWIVAVILLWVSAAWTTREKAIGTLVVPGGLLPAFLMMFMPVGMETCIGGTNRRGQTVQEECTGGVSTLEQLGLWALFAVLVIGPIASAIYLGVRLRRRAPVAH